MQIALTLTSRCNAACRHCSTSCGPRRTTALTIEHILRVIDQAAAVPGHGPLRVLLTGGEAFLDLPRLRAVIAHAAGLGGQVSCVSNGYWASSDEKARLILADLGAAGLTLLGLSVSRYHSEYIHPQRVRRALIVARELGIETVLKCVTTRHDKLVTGIPDWLDFATLADRVECFAVMGLGRMDAPLESEDLITRAGLPTGLCPESTLSIASDGTAFVCGASAPLNAFHAIGSIRDHDILTLFRRSAHGGKHQVLRESGPRALAEAVIAAGEGDRLRPDYVSVCDLCSHIAHEPVMAQIAERYGQQIEVERLQALLRQLVPASASEVSDRPALLANMRDPKSRINL